MSDSKTKFGNLNLKVSEDEKWAFKEFCARHRMSQVDAFRKAVKLLEEQLEGQDDGKRE